MRVRVNVYSFCLSQEEKIEGAKHNAQVLSDRELLDSYLDAIRYGKLEICAIYKQAILNRMGK